MCVCICVLTRRLSPPLLAGVVALAAGGWHTCALLASGGVDCWGWNSNGQLGTGDTAIRYTPTGVTGLGAGGWAELFPVGTALSPQCRLSVTAHESDGSVFRVVFPGRRLAVALMSQLTRAKGARFGKLFQAGASLSPQCRLDVEAHESEGRAFWEVISGRRLAVALMSQLTRAMEARFGNNVSNEKESAFRKIITLVALFSQVLLLS